MTTRRSRLARLATLLGAVGALAALLAGCSLPWQPQSQPSSDMAKDQTLRMIWDMPFVQPDPGSLGDASQLQLDNLLFDGLVTEDRNGHVEPWGASSWTVSADGLTYTFTLRRDQRFSDGTPVKPSDYAWSMNRIANSCFQSGVAYLFDVLMRQADALSDMRQRVPLYQQAEQLLIDNVAVCPLFQEVNRYALRPWVKGDFVEDGRGFFPNDAWVSGYIAKH